MRKLNTADVFAFCRILRKADLKKEIAQITIDKTGEDVAQVGIEIIFALIEGAGSPDVEKEIYSFLAGVTEKTVEEIKALEINEFFEILKQIAEENDLKGFFTSIATLMR